MLQEKDGGRGQRLRVTFCVVMSAVNSIVQLFYTDINQSQLVSTDTDICGMPLDAYK